MPPSLVSVSLHSYGFKHTFMTKLHPSNTEPGTNVTVPRVSLTTLAHHRSSPPVLPGTPTFPQHHPPDPGIHSATGFTTRSGRATRGVRRAVEGAAPCLLTQWTLLSGGRGERHREAGVKVETHIFYTPTAEGTIWLFFLCYLIELARSHSNIKR